VTSASTIVCIVSLAAGCGGDSDRGVDPDAAIDLTPAVAVPAARCARSERIGLIEISAGKVVRADLYDRTDPWITDPALADSSCGFHSFVPEQCTSCSDEQLCDTEGQCVAIPRRDVEARLVVRAGGEEQVFEAEPVAGELGGAITLPGASFAVEVTAFGQRVTLEVETGVPDPLPEFSASLLGTYDAPEGIEASWDPVAEGSHLFTRIPVNHHAAGPTFTECAVDGSVGSLEVSQAMLEPLAVATGLEFQSFEHIRFAAAETSRGCVELRFTQPQSRGLDGL
jgi:hypothetical protein